MTDVLKELQAYLDGDNSVVMSKRLVSETIAELAAERESATKANLDFVKMLRRADELEAERDALSAQLDEACEALEPFALWANTVRGSKYFEELSDEHILMTTGAGECDCWVDMKAFRHASDTLTRIDATLNKGGAAYFEIIRLRAELAAERTRYIELLDEMDACCDDRTRLRSERDELYELLGKAWVALYTTGSLYDDDMRRIAAVLQQPERLVIKVDGNVGTPKPNQKIEIKRGGE